MDTAGWATRFLRWICPSHLYEEIEGDLIQKFEKDVKRYGNRRAKIRFVWNTVRFFRPGIILRNKFTFELNQMDMLISHLRFAIRIFLKDKFFSSLNILGLALGISVSIILLLVLQNDLTYDQYYANHENIYRVGCDLRLSGNDSRGAWSARELGPVLKEEYPEVESFVRIEKINRSLIKFNDRGEEKSFYSDAIVQADSNYFQFFLHDFIAGDSKTCLSDPHSAVLSESAANAYFGGIDALDKSITLGGKTRKVTGIIKDLPENTHLKFDVLLSGLPDSRDWAMSKGRPTSEAFWNPDVYLYISFPENYDPQKFKARFPVIYSKYMKEMGDQIGGRYDPILQPLADIHFTSGIEDDLLYGNKAYLYSFTGIGILIIFLACINYMNLSTARATGRAIEIAMKKVVGSGKRVIVFSLLSESVFLALVSYVLAVALVFIVLDLTTFNQLINKNLRPDFFSNRLLLFGSLGLAVGVGILSGLYSAFYLPSMPTLAALKGAFRNSKASHSFRRFLITAQFAISIFVVVCTLFMSEQVNYMRNKDLGFNKENILVLAINDTLVKKQVPAIKNEMLRNPNILSATTVHAVMGMNIGTGVMLGESDTGMRQQGGMGALSVGEDFLKTMDITLLSGRDFQRGEKIDLEGVYIANESAVRAMGWGDDALGKKVSFFHGQNPGKVIGVVKDFNSSSLHQPAEPMFILKANWFNGYLQLRVSGKDLPQTIEYVREKWTTFDPNHPFEYFFLDQRFNEQYKADETQNKLLSVLSFICIFISLLGLIGLSAFTATQRTKEIGVRKVLGANISDIILLLSKESLLLVVVSSVLIIPLSWWVVNLWLENFAYRMELNYFLYGAVTILALGFVFLTVLFQSLKTARSNPVDSLKYE